MKQSIASYDTAFRAFAWVLLAASVIAVLIARTHLSGLPLERDEGEYAYGGQLMLQGIPPYKFAYSMKLPGTAAAYAAIMSVFGQSPEGIHIGLALMNLVTIGLIFLLGRELLGQIGALASAACYAVLSLMPHVLGTAAHATHFVVLFAVAGLYLLLRAIDGQSRPLIFVSGLMFGFGFLMKQPGLFFIIFAAVYLFARDWRARLNSLSIVSRNLLFIAGAAVPAVVTALLLWKVGVFDKFWFWTIRYATAYGSQVSASQGLQVFAGHFVGVLGTAWPIWLLGLIGAVAVTVDSKLRGRAAFLATLSAFSAMAVCPGLYFRPHYFILFLPALAILAGAATAAASRWFRGASQFAVLLVAGICLAFPLWSERDFFFQRPIAEANRLINGTNPFPESIKIGEYIRAQSNPEDKIAVLGSEPQIYFYSKRLSATGYIYTYALMEPQPYAHQMQEEMMHEIENSQPRFLVLVVMNKSWLAFADSDQTILRWADRYCTSNYDEVGLINITDAGTDYYFSDVPPGVAPTADHILIYRRKT